MSAPTPTARYAASPWSASTSCRPRPATSQHANAGGGELMIVDVTDPATPRSPVAPPGSTSTHTVACVQQTNCTYAYSAGDDSTGRFSIFDLRNLDKPVEVDSDPETAGVQPFARPTAGPQVELRRRRVRHPHRLRRRLHVGHPPTRVRPRLVTTTGAAGQGRRPEVPRLERLHPPQLVPPQRQGLPQRRGAVARQRQRPAGDRGGLRAARLQQGRLVPDVVGQAPRRDEERDRAAGQGGAGRPRHVPAAVGRVLLLALVRLPPVGHRRCRLLRRRHPVHRRTQPAATSSPTATPRGAPRRSGTPVGAGLPQRPADDGEEDQRRLLDRPGPRARRLHRRPAGTAGTRAPPRSPPWAAAG